MGPPHGPETPNNQHCLGGSHHPVLPAGSPTRHPCSCDPVPGRSRGADSPQPPEGPRLWVCWPELPRYSPRLSRRLQNTPHPLRGSGGPP